MLLQLDMYLLGKNYSCQLCFEDRCWKCHLDLKDLKQNSTPFLLPPSHPTCTTCSACNLSISVNSNSSLLGAQIKHFAAIPDFSFSLIPPHEQALVHSTLKMYPESIHFLPSPIIFSLTRLLALAWINAKSSYLVSWIQPLSPLHSVLWFGFFFFS